VDFIYPPSFKKWWSTQVMNTYDIRQKRLILFSYWQSQPPKKYTAADAPVIIVASTTSSITVEKE